MIKISIIMPVYNSEKYITDAAKSVLGQDLTELELILIDDGSTDESGKICDVLSEKDARVIVVHQQNSGISAARNVGIEAARGEYIAFIDNDDLYVDGFLSTVYAYASENNADVVKYGYRVIEEWHKDESEARTCTFTKAGKIDFENIHVEYSKLKAEGLFNMVWNGIYKREFINAHNILFDQEVKKGYEDWIFNFELFPLTKKIFTWKKIEYNHYQRTSHSTSSQYHENQQMALIRAAEKEYHLVQILNDKYDARLDWNEYAMAHFIEALLMFEKRNCNLSKKRKTHYLYDLSRRESFRQLGTKAVRTNIPKTKKIVSILLERKKFGLLLYFTHIYNKYLVYKRKKMKYGQEVE